MFIRNKLRIVTFYKLRILVKKLINRVYESRMSLVRTIVLDSGFYGLNRRFSVGARFKVGHVGPQMRIKMAYVRDFGAHAS